MSSKLATGDSERDVASGEHALASPGKRSLSERLPVQRAAAPAAAVPVLEAPLSRRAATEDPFWFAPGPAAADADQAVQARGALDQGVDVQAVAAEGVAGAGGSLPFLDTIQASFGRHDVSGVQAHVGGAAGDAARTIGASAYATGNSVAFGASPDLETAAHEAAHVVQQRAGVQLKGGVGEAGDLYEQHADAVASRVVQGQSAEGLLDQLAGTGASAAAAAPVQRKLNMVAGYTEALNWSSEAQELITQYDALVELVEELEGLRPQMVGRTFQKRRSQINQLRAFLTALERQRIPNDKTVREARTAEVVAKLTHARNVRAGVLTRLGRAASAAQDDELDAPDAEHDIVDPTVWETPSGDTPTPELPAIGGGNSTATATDNSTALVPYEPPPEAEPEESLASQAVQAVEFTIIGLDKRKLFDDRNGRLGSATSEVGGGLKASGGDGLQGELKGKLKLVVGKSGEHTSAPLDLLALASGPKVQVRAKSEAMVGGKAEASGEGSMSVSREGVKGSLKGTASAFLGGSVEIAPQVRFVDAEGTPLAAMTGIGGLTYGVGGSYEGLIAVEGWTFKFSSKGKMSAGLGLAWGVSAEIDAGALSAKLYHAIVG